MKKWLWIFILIPSICFAGSIQHYHSKIAKSRVAGSSWLLYETAESGGGGACETWTGNQDYAYTTTVLSGNASINLQSSSNDTSVFSGANEVWMAFELQLPADLASNTNIIAITATGSGNACTLRLPTSGYAYVLTAGGSNISQYDVSLDTLHYMKLRAKYVDGAGNDECEWWAQTGESWSQIGVSTDGSFPGQPVEAELDGDGSSIIIVDELRVDDADITTVNETNTTCP